MARALSFGGQVVEGSLREVGVRSFGEGLALVESSIRVRRFQTVLVQNAWNAIPQPEFRTRIREYPPSLRRRAQLRRAVSRRNIRRADKVVTLTYAMEQLVRDGVGVAAEVAPVSVPLQDWPDAPGPAATGRRLCVVPGTVTWFKRPGLALDWVAGSGDRIDTILFCGRDDGSGAWDDVKVRAAELGLRVDRRVLNRGELYGVMASAELVVLPSGLESLGFGLAEALLVARRVVASPIPAHLEVAERVGGPIEWLEAEGSGARPMSPRGAVMTKEEAVREWVSAADALGLVRGAAHD